MKPKTNSPTPPEDAELREAFIKAGFQILDNRKVAKQTFFVITENEFAKIASTLGFQASRIRAEVLEEVGSKLPEMLLADPKYRNLAADKDHSTDYFRALGHDLAIDRVKQAIATLRQKPGERGQYGKSNA